MSAIAWHFASGGAFFSGLTLVTAGIICLFVWEAALVASIARLAAVTGVAFVVLSGTALPFGLYVAWVVLVLLALLPTRWQRWHRVSQPLRAVGVLSSIAFALIELPHQLTSTPLSGGYERVYVIGDSISAGVGKEDRTWPRLLQERLAIPVTDLSRAGATTRSACREATKVGTERALVILQIGGNDLLRGSPADEFAADVRELLTTLASPERDIIMFELPLPPFRNSYGAVQRRLSGELGAILVPRRLFAGVLRGRGSTLDGVHLSDKGHREMAEMVAGLMRPAPLSGALQGTTMPP